MSASPPSICSTGRPLATCSRWPGVDAAAAAAAVAGFGAAAAAAGVAAAVQGGVGAAGAEFRELMHRFEAAAAGVRQGWHVGLETGLQATRPRSRGTLRPSFA